MHRIWKSPRRFSRSIGSKRFELLERFERIPASVRCQYCIGPERSSQADCIQYLDHETGALRLGFTSAQHFLKPPRVELVLKAADAIDEEFPVEVINLVL